jgi:diguanylate cyclase (GGDEF)-like protein
MRQAPDLLGPTTTRLLQGLGLSEADVSPEAIAVLERLTGERRDLSERLAAAEALADRDALAPVFNRRAFLRELYRTMSEVERYRTPAAVIYLDLDGFKALNDAYGHAAGDAVLTHVGRLLRESVRESDVVGRLGGDEFGIILNRAAPEEAHAKALALREFLHATPVLHAGIAHRLRASFGVHAIASVEDPELAIARADEAMYADKYARRTHGASSNGL